MRSDYITRTEVEYELKFVNKNLVNLANRVTDLENDFKALVAASGVEFVNVPSSRVIRRVVVGEQVPSQPPAKENA